MNFFDLVFFHVASFHVLYLRGCSQMMSCAEGGEGVGQKVIFHDKGGRGGQEKSDFL